MFLRRTKTILSFVERFYSASVGYLLALSLLDASGSSKDLRIVNYKKSTSNPYVSLSLQMVLLSPRFPHCLWIETFTDISLDYTYHDVKKKHMFPI